MKFGHIVLAGSAIVTAGCSAAYHGAPGAVLPEASSRAPAAPPAQIAVPFLTPTGDFHINVSVGGGPVRQVVFDTGSIGMHILAPAAGPGVKRTNVTFSNEYADGTIYSGVLGTATVNLGGVQTSSNTPVGIVDKIYCTPNKPHCPGQGGMKGAIAANKFGVIGVRFSGLSGGTSFDSPLGYLPPPYDRGFVVTRQTLYLGLTRQIRASFKTVSLARLPGRNGNGFPAWENSVKAKWSLSGRVLTGGGLKTLFDTGTSAILMSVPAGAIPASSVNSQGYLDGGLALRMAIPRVVDFRFRSGSTVGVDAVDVLTASSLASSYANTGWAPFDSYDVLYDPIRGLMGLRKRAP